jgi:biopolymer transport protein ExbB/TolQ
MMERASTPFARIYTRGLQNYGRPPELIEMAMAHEAANEITDIEYWRPGLRVIAIIAPMTGLAATITKIQIILDQAQTAGTWLILGTIGQAFTTVAIGIAICILCCIFDSYYRNLVRRFLEDAQYYAAELTNFLTGRIAG